MSIVSIEVDITVDEVLREANKSEILEFVKEKFNVFENLEEIDDEDLIEELNGRGYEIQERKSLEDLYYPDDVYLEEIINKFHSLNIFDRENIHKIIMKL